MKKYYSGVLQQYISHKPYKLEFCIKKLLRLFSLLLFIIFLQNYLVDYNYMGRTRMPLQANPLFLRKMKQLKWQFRGLVIDSTSQQALNKKDDETETESLPYNSSTWVPHPRTGIYFPQGHEWVMKDIPENAASFPRLCWFRDSDDVDDLNPDKDTSSTS